RDHTVVEPVAILVNRESGDRTDDFSRESSELLVHEQLERQVHRLDTTAEPGGPDQVGGGCGQGRQQLLVNAAIAEHRRVRQGGTMMWQRSSSEGLVAGQFPCTG